MDFIGALLEMQNGRVASEINREWADLLNAIIENGGGGTFTLKLAVKPVGTDESGRVSQVEIDHDIKASKPKRRSGKAFFFTTQDGNLSRKDQRQEEIEFASIKKEAHHG